MTDREYARQLRQLLPPGRLWNPETDSELSALLLAIATELARVDARGDDLIDETDPRTADETLPEWERMLGLPDDQVTEIPATTGERRLAVTQKYVGRGGQNAAFFIALALACGYDVTLSKFDGGVNGEPPAADILRAGFRAGATVPSSGPPTVARAYGSVYAYALMVTVQAVLPVFLPQDAFERVLRRAAQSHVEIGFIYL